MQLVHTLLILIQPYHLNTCLGRKVGNDAPDCEESGGAFGAFGAFEHLLSRSGRRQLYDNLATQRMVSLFMTGLAITAPFGINSSAKHEVPRRTLTDVEKLAYIDAELCLMGSPAQLDEPGVKTRWDDLHWVHIVQSNYIHDDVSTFNLGFCVYSSR